MQKNWAALYSHQKKHSTDHGMRELWFRVITQALEDAKSGINTPQMYANKLKAEAWLTGGSADFCMVCELADIDPDIARRAFQRFFSGKAENVSLKEFLSQFQFNEKGQMYVESW